MTPNYDLSVTILLLPYQALNVSTQSVLGIQTEPTGHIIDVLKF